MARMFRVQFRTPTGRIAESVNVTTPSEKQVVKAAVRMVEHENREGRRSKVRALAAQVWEVYPVFYQARDGGHETAPAPTEHDPKRVKCCHCGKGNPETGSLCYLTAAVPELLKGA